MDLDEACKSCQHSWYDHAGRFTEDERARIMSKRTIGCWVVGCGCDTFQRYQSQPEYEIWED